MRDRGKRKSGVLASALRFGRSSLFFDAASSILTDGGSPENDVEPVADQRRKKECMLSQHVTRTNDWSRGKEGETRRENSQSDTDSKRRLQELPHSNQSSLPLLLLGKNIHDVLIERVRMLFESDVGFSS